MSEESPVTREQEFAHILILKELEFAANCLWRYREPRNDIERTAIGLTSTATAEHLFITLACILGKMRLSPVDRHYVAEELGELRGLISLTGNENRHQPQYSLLVDIRLGLHAELELGSAPAPAPAQS